LVPKEIVLKKVHFLRYVKIKCNLERYKAQRTRAINCLQLASLTQLAVWKIAKT